MFIQNILTWLHIHNTFIKYNQCIKARGATHVFSLYMYVLLFKHTHINTHTCLGSSTEDLH